jgi:hypothetical protein
LHTLTQQKCFILSELKIFYAPGNQHRTCFQSKEYWCLQKAFCGYFCLVDIYTPCFLASPLKLRSRWHRSVTPRRKYRYLKLVCRLSCSNQTMSAFHCEVRRRNRSHMKNKAQMCCVFKRDLFLTMREDSYPGIHALTRQTQTVTVL